MWIFIIFVYLIVYYYFMYLLLCKLVQYYTGYGTFADTLFKKLL